MVAILVKFCWLLCCGKLATGLKNFLSFLSLQSETKQTKMAKLTKEKVKSCMKSSALTLATLIGVIGGVIFGLCLRQRERKWSSVNDVTCTLFILPPLSRFIATKAYKILEPGQTYVIYSRRAFWSFNWLWFLAFVFIFCEIRTSDFRDTICISDTVATTYLDHFSRCGPHYLNPKISFDLTVISAVLNLWCTISRWYAKIRILYCICPEKAVFVNFFDAR